MQFYHLSKIKQSMSRLTERFVLQFKKKVTEIHDIKKK